VNYRFSLSEDQIKKDARARKDEFEIYLNQKLVFALHQFKKFAKAVIDYFTSSSTG
jgi:hypothetical protein